MPPLTNCQWILGRTPTGPITADVFVWQKTKVPKAGPGEVLVRSRMLSIDPAQRAWMSGRTYREQVMPGDLMPAFGVGEVISSGAPGFEPGDLVDGMLGWQNYVALPSAELTKRGRDLDLELLIGVLSITGLTAYYGLFDVGQIKAGDTVVISAAAGAVGTIAGQLAKVSGCRVVGVAGGAEKCAWLREDLGFDAVVDYKAGNIRRQLRAACPEGVDVYFDNVGGEVLDAALLGMNQRGVVVCCGAVSGYDAGGAQPRSALLPGILIPKRLTMRGFLLRDHLANRPVVEKRLLAWIAEGRLKPIVDISEGLESAPAALISLLAGGNRGKAAVKVA